MKNFLEKHVLFNKEFGIQPYVYLIFLLPVFPVVFTTASLFGRIIFLALILVFLKGYRDGYEVTKYHVWHIAVQLIVSTFLALNPWFPYWGLMIFTGFEIGFSLVPQKRFVQYVIAYYVTLIVSYAIPVALSFKNIPSSGLIWIATSFFFGILCVPFARSINKNYALKTTNKELENQVRQLERERIAYDLHDNLGQTFSTITLKAEFAERLLGKSEVEKARQELTEITQLSRDSLTLVRSIVTNLKESNLSEVLKEGEKSLKMADVDFEIENEELSENWVQAQKTIAAEVLKEALTNIIHHAKATRAFVKFDKQGFTVSDNGIGLKNNQPSHGILGMRRRVESIGGKMTLRTYNGTQLEVRFK